MNDEAREIRDLVDEFTKNASERVERARQRVYRRMREKGHLVDEPGPLRRTEEAKRKLRRGGVRWRVEQAEKIIERYRGIPMPAFEGEYLMEILAEAERLADEIERE